MDPVLHQQAWKSELTINRYRSILWMVLGAGTYVLYMAAGRDIPMMAHLAALWGAATLLYGQGALRRHYAPIVPAILSTMDIIVLVVAKDDLIRTSPHLSDRNLAHEAYGTALLLMLALGPNMLRFSRAVTIWCVFFASICYFLFLVKNHMVDTGTLLDVVAFWSMGGFLVFAVHEKHQAVERIKQRDSLARFLPGPIVERVSQNPDELKLGGDIQEATILFADIRGFTTMSEGLKPGEVVALLNEYFTQMVDEIFHWHGVLDKFMGDGLYAVFGPSTDHEDQARRAIRCAQFMLRRLNYINGLRASRREPPLRIGIGIHTGIVVAGSVGSRQRMEYTHIGDAVNCTARIEELCKEYKEVLLISEATYTRAGGEEFVKGRPMPPVILRGRSEGLGIFALDPPGTELKQGMRESASAAKS